MNAEERLLEKDEVARRLGIKPVTAVRMMRAGELPAFKFGKGWKVREADLDAYIRELATRQTSQPPNTPA
jgi:excisionase family DNA binding protein